MTLFVIFLLVSVSRFCGDLFSPPEIIYQAWVMVMEKSEKCCGTCFVFGARRWQTFLFIEWRNELTSFCFERFLTSDCLHNELQSWKTCAENCRSQNSFSMILQSTKLVFWANIDSNFFFMNQTRTTETWKDKFHRKFALSIDTFNWLCGQLLFVTA